MELLNIHVAPGGWVQVYDGTKDASVGVSSKYAYVCQSDVKPDDSLDGFTLAGGGSRGFYTATKGSPVWVKVVIEPVIVIINV